jgi:acyl-CoA thioesterase I
MQFNFLWFPVVVAALLASGCTQKLDSCGGPPEGWGYDGVGRPLPILSTVPPRLRIVALGSSSTEGVGASTPAGTYPAQLQRVLDIRYPEADIEVFNKGIAQEVVASNLVRLDRDVLSLSPDLVIWQVGTNDAIYLDDLTTVLEQVQSGIDRIRKSGAHLAILSPQSFADEMRDEQIRRMNDALRELALANEVPFLDRYWLMTWWLDSRTLFPDEVLGGDALHMSDRSYECLATRIADLIPALVPPQGGQITSPPQSPLAASPEQPQVHLPRERSSVVRDGTIAPHVRAGT